MQKAESGSHVEYNLRCEEPDPSAIVLDNDNDKYVLVAPLRRSDLLVEVNGRVVHDGIVGPGMLRLIVPGDRNRVTIRAAAEAMFLSVPGRVYRQITSDLPAKELLPGFHMGPFIERNAQVANLSTALRSLLDIDRRQRQLFVDGLAHSMLAVLLSVQKASAGRGETPGKRGLTDAQFAKCLDYADSRISERLDLDSWAATIDMSASEFARRFQQKAHLTPYAWFMDWRINRAKQLLSQPTRSVVEIAMEVGFCSQSHFTEAFRRRAGLAPGRWRSQTLGRSLESLKNLDSAKNRESHL